VRITAYTRPDGGERFVLVLEASDMRSWSKGRSLYIELDAMALEDLRALACKESEQYGAEAEAASSASWLARYIGDGSD